MWIGVPCNPTAEPLIRDLDAPGFSPQQPGAYGIQVRNNVILRNGMVALPPIIRVTIPNPNPAAAEDWPGEWDGYAGTYLCHRVRNRNVLAFDPWLWQSEITRDGSTADLFVNPAQSPFQWAFQPLGGVRSALVPFNQLESLIGPHSLRTIRFYVDGGFLVGHQISIRTPARLDGTLFLRKSWFIEGDELEELSVVFTHTPRRFTVSWSIGADGLVSDGGIQWWLYHRGGPLDRGFPVWNSTQSTGGFNTTASNWGADEQLVMNQFRLGGFGGTLIEGGFAGSPADTEIFGAATMTPVWP